MGELCRVDVPEEMWFNVLHLATQTEVDAFLALLEQHGMKIIVVDEYNRVLSLVDQSMATIETLESCIKAQSDEITALELRIKTLMRP